MICKSARFYKPIHIISNVYVLTLCIYTTKANRPNNSISLFNVCSTLMLKLLSYYTLKLPEYFESVQKYFNVGSYFPFLRVVVVQITLLFELDPYFAAILLLCKYKQRLVPAAIQMLNSQSLVPRAENKYSQCRARYQFKFQNSCLEYTVNLTVIYIRSSSDVLEDGDDVRASQSALSPRLLISSFSLSKMPLEKLKDRQKEISYITEFSQMHIQGDRYWLVLNEK